MTETLSRVRAKVIEAVPEIMQCSVCAKINYSSDCFLQHAGQEIARDITLADVLMAMQKTNPANITRVRIECGGAMYLTMGEEANHIQGNWDMSLPLDQQSEKTIAFLDNILSV